MCDINYYCEFCDLQKNQGASLPEYLQDTPVDGLCQDIIYKGEYFYVKPDISPVVENHLLIIPQKHIFCMKEVPVEYEDELNDIKNLIIHYFHNLRMNYLFFEHGCCNEKEPGSSCINHAHLHAIPVNNATEKAILREIIKKAGYPIVLPYKEKKATYLFLESSLVSKPLYWTDDIQRSQLFRIIIANITGHIRRARWQNCLIDEVERKRSEEWLQKFKNFSLA